MSNARDRLRAAILDAKRQSVLLSAYSAARPDRKLLVSIAENLAISLALAEASLHASQPLLESQTITLGGPLTINGDATITGKILPSAIWLNLGDEVKS